MRFLALLLMMSLAACHHWAKPGVSDQDARMQHFLCVQQANAAGGNSMDRGYYRDTCMEAQGFRWVFGR